MDDEISFDTAMSEAPAHVEASAVETQAQVETPVVEAITPETAEVPETAESPLVEALDPRFTAEEHTRIEATLEALKLAGQEVSKEAFVAEVVRAKEALAAESAQVAQSEVAESQRSYAEALLARRDLDPSDPKWLTEEAAEELWQEKLRVATLERELAARDAKSASSEKERLIDRVRAEFPDADEEILRTLVDSGKNASEIQSWAKRDADRLAKREEMARARYAGVKEAHKNTTAVTGAGLGTNAAASREMTFEESMR